jgi:L-ascorbate metabolism protein UlaG (beta-lactamase superfamily)
MTTTLRFLGASGYEIVGPRHRILMEPFLRGNPVAPYKSDDVPPPDLILVSHAAWDHLGDTAEIARRTGAPVGCPADVAAKLLEDGVAEDRIRPLIWGVCYAFGDIVVRPVESHHWSSATLRDGRVITGVPLSFIVDTEPGVRIYHFGDTAIFPGLALIGELYRPTVGILGCAQTDGLPDPGAGEVLTGEMNPDEAARAAAMLGVRHVVASHYIHPGPEVEELRRLVPRYDDTERRLVHAPAGGATITIDPEPNELPSLTWGRSSEAWEPAYRPAVGARPGS